MTYVKLTMTILLELLPGFVLTLVSAALIIGLVYYPNNARNSEYGFTFITFSVLLYFIISLLRDVQLSLGFGFGLLAVFSTLNYRTMNIPTKEMTYLFICITLPFMNTLFLVTRVTFIELIIINLFIVFCIFSFEKLLGVPYSSSKRITYEKIELIKPENRALLLEDLVNRTGLHIQRLEIDRIDFLRDTAEITVFYEEQRGNGEEVTR
jgi:hypothetical protein